MLRTLLTASDRAARAFAVLCLAGPVIWSCPPVRASLDHRPIFPHIKVFVAAFGSNYTPEQLQFMASHYDLVEGSRLQGYGDSVQLMYDNYYMVYVGNSQYQDMKAWAQSHGVDFESFFIHYAEPTRACYNNECYDLPAGSRVPTYAWYGTGGDLTKNGARIVCNPGNPNYRAWKLDSLERNLGQYDGVMIDNTIFGSIPQLPTHVSGGTIKEYPTDPGPSYNNDILLSLIHI